MIIKNPKSKQTPEEAFTEKFQNYFVETYVSTKGNIVDACLEASISDSLFYKWLKEDSKFSKRIKKIDKRILNYVHSQLMNKIKSGDTKAIIYFLENKKLLKKKRLPILLTK